MSCVKSTDPQDNNLKLVISPSDQTVNVDNQADYNVILENADDLFGFSAEIIFNGNIIELPENSVVTGDIWGDNSITVVENEIDRLSITIGLIQTSETDVLTGDLNLFTFTVQGKASGSSQLSFQNLYLIDEDGNEIPGIDDLEIETGNITVQ